MGARMGGVIKAFGVTVRGNADLAIGAVSGLTIGNALLDFFASQQASTLIGSIAQFIAQVVVTRVATQRLYPEPFPPRVGGFFLLSILTSVGVVAGLAMVILPGLYLAARWLVAGPVMLVERDGVIEAMRRSWVITAPLAWPICWLLAVLWAPALLVVFIGSFWAEMFNGAASESTNLAVLALTYFAMASASVASWIAAVAAFGLLDPKIGGSSGTLA